MLRVQLGTIGTSLAQTGSPISQTGNQSMLDWFAHLTDRKPVHARLVPVFPFMESSCHFIIIILPRLSAYPFMESSCRFNPQAALRVHINKAMEPPIRLARTSYHNYLIMDLSIYICIQVYYHFSLASSPAGVCHSCACGWRLARILLTIII